MWRKIEDYTQKHKMICRGDRILLGLSGGADSVLLARYLLTLREKKQIFLAAVHVNHQLRGGEAERDEDFVRAFCDKWQLPCYVCREDVRGYAGKEKCSLEEAGRILRHRCFADHASITGCDKIALAHHADDLAETMIFRMARGTGPEGIPGILPANGPYIRPLLCLEKEEVRSMLTLLSQDYVEDSSNLETEFSRNYIRSHILPEMNRLNPRAVLHMTRLSGLMQEQNEFIRQHFDRMYHEEKEVSPGSVRVSLPFLRGCEDYAQREIIRRMLFEAGGKRKDLTAVHVELVQDLISKDPGKRLDLPHGIKALLEEDSLHICILNKPDPGRDGTSGIPREDPGTGRKEGPCYKVDRDRLEAGQAIRIDTGQGEEYFFELISPVPREIWKNDCARYFNYDRMKGEVFLRTRRQGDYLVIDPAGRKKLLRRYFIDQKIPPSEREKLFLLAEGNHILWISGGRISEAYKVTDQTGCALRVTCTKKTEEEEDE